MSGGGTKVQEQRIDPGFKNDLNRQVERAQSASERATPAFERAAAGIQTGFQPGPQLELFRPQFSQGLDQFSRQALSQARGEIGAQQAQLSRNIGQQFAGRPGQAQALRTQAQIQSQLAANPLQSQILQQQGERELQQQTLAGRVSELNNQARLSQIQQANQQQQLANQALAQQAGLSAAPIQAEAGILGALGGVAPLFGKQVTKEGK